MIDQRSFHAKTFRSQLMAIRGSGGETGVGPLLAQPSGTTSTGHLKHIRFGVDMSSQPGVSSKPNCSCTWLGLRFMCFVSLLSFFHPGLGWMGVCETLAAGQICDLPSHLFLSLFLSLSFSLSLSLPLLLPFTSPPPVVHLPLWFMGLEV